MEIQTVLSLVVLITLAIISVSLILMSLVGTLLQYKEVKRERESFELNINMLFLTVFIPLVYLSVLGFVVYAV